MATSLAREMNDVLADMVAGNPTRFAALAAVAPQDPEAAAEEIGRATGTLGFGGALIGSDTGGRYLDEPESEPILAAIEETDSTLYPRCSWSSASPNSCHGRSIVWIARNTERACPATLSSAHAVASTRSGPRRASDGRPR